MLVELRDFIRSNVNAMVEAPHKSRSGLLRIWRAFFYSLAGFGAALKHEHAFRQELFLAFILLPFALLLPLSLAERALLIATLLLVLVVELLNSAIEAVVDRVSLENHELSKRAKDMGSAAVFLSCVITVIIWGGIAGPVVFKSL
jgi:diacylglycerol kinase (ATP)